jgi:WD40 repeat protein
VDEQVNSVATSIRPGRSLRLRWAMLAGILISPLLIAFTCSALVAALTPAGQVHSFGHGLPVYTVAWAPDGKRLASGSQDGTIGVWDVSNDRAVIRLDDDRGSVDTVSWSPDGRYLAAAVSHPTKKLRVWDTQTWQPVFMTAPLPNGAYSYSSVEDITWAPDSKQLAVGVGVYSSSHDPPPASAVKIYAVPGGDNTATLVYPEPVYSTVWLPDGKHIAFTTAQMELLIWDLMKGVGSSNGENTKVLVLALNGDTASKVRYSPDGRFLAVGLNSGYEGHSVVKIWDAATGQEVATWTLSGETSHVTEVAWAPDGQHLAASSEDGTVQVLDIVQQKVVATFVSGNWVYCVAWSPDGKLLASGGLDNSVRVWEVKP